MSMCSLTDFIETSLGRCGGSVSTATVTGQGASWVDPSARGGDFSWPKVGTLRGHQRGLQLAITGDFFMATDNWPIDWETERTLTAGSIVQLKVGGPTTDYVYLFLS